MSSQVSKQVRLVRCPKCQRVLAELPDVPLYKCGGCGTVLEAKNRRRETSTTEPSTQVADPVAKRQQDDDLEATSGSDKDIVRCRDENGESEGFREGRIVLYNSPEVHFSRNEDSSTESNDHPKHDSLSQISGSTFREDIGESSRGREFSDELPSSGELALNLVEQQHGDEFVKEVRNHEYPETVLSHEEENNNHILPENDGTVDMNGASGNVSCENEGTENDMNTSISGSRVPSRSPSKESLVSFYLMSSDREHPDHIPAEASHGHFGRYNSPDISEMSSVSVSSLPKFPKNESYYANVSSESSYDGDQISQRVLRKNKVAETRTSTILKTKNGFSGNNKTQSSENHSLPTNRNHHWERGKPIGTNRLNGSGPTGYSHDLLPPRPKYPEDPDNINLIRTVCELKDQLSRITFPQVRRFPCEMERENYSDARRSIGYNHNRTCPHCFPQDYRYSIQLSPNSPCRVHTRPYASSEASLWGYEKPLEKQRHKEEITERARLNEKYFVGKRHLRPVAGGAPVVTCYRCSELLCLPSDFLLFRKKCHSLICNACKQVLRFSLREGTHIVPYIQNQESPAGPPSSFVESVKPRLSSSALRQTDRPVSCSDKDYNRNMSSELSDYQVTKDRKMKSVLIEPEESVGSSGSSTTMPKWIKRKSEIVERSSSPLHRLMGYASPSQVMDKRRY